MAATVFVSPFDTLSADRQEARNGCGRSIYARTRHSQKRALPRTDSLHCHVKQIDLRREGSPRALSSIASAA